MGNIPASAALTEFEAQCQDLQAAGLTVEQSAAILEVGPGSVRQALRNLSVKAKSATRTEYWQERRRDVERAAMNHRAVEEPVAVVAGGAVHETSRDRWVTWPFVDHARQAG
jgi:DNA-binding CsgD family transcriptional regulator